MKAARDIYNTRKRRVKRMMQQEYKAKDTTTVSDAAMKTAESFKQADTLIAKHTDSKVPPPSAAAPSSADISLPVMKPAPQMSVKPAVKPEPPSQLANVSTTSATSTTPMAAAAAAAARGTGDMRDFQKVAARKYIDPLEKYCKAEDLTANELEDALNAQALSHQANIIATHPTFRPWLSDFHLTNILASQRRSSSQRECLISNMLCCTHNFT
jgi:hypothetical protein